MDALGVAQAVIALTIYPGGLFIGAAAWLLRHGAALSREALTSPAGIASIGCAVLAAALAPLPASPAALLPPAAGAAPNLAIATTLLAAAVAMAGTGSWNAGRLLAAGLCLVSVAALAIGVATFALPTITAGSTAALIASRGAAAAAVLTLAPVICGTFRPGATAVRATLTASMAVVAFSLLVPVQLTGLAAAVAAVTVLVATGVYAVVMRVAIHAAGAMSRALIILGMIATAITVAAVAVGGH